MVWYTMMYRKSLFKLSQFVSRQHFKDFLLLHLKCQTLTWEGLKYAMCKMTFIGMTGVRMCAIKQPVFQRVFLTALVYLI